MKEFWNFIQMVFMAVGGWLGWFMGGCDGLLYALIAFCGDRLSDRGDVCFCGPYAFQRGGIPGDLQEGADFSVGGNGEYSGCGCDREWICAEDGGGLFLYFQ